MISFIWNNVSFSITDIGGGALGMTIPRHAHSKNSYELHFITGGSGELITDFKSYRLKAGDFFITGPGVYHEQNTDMKNPVNDIFIMIHAVNAGRANAISSALLNTHFCYCEGFDYAAARQILEEYRAKKTDFKSAVSGLAMKLLTDIARRILPQKFDEKALEENLSDRRFVIIEQSFLYSPNITLTELSNKIGVCERQTQRLLKKYYGKSFREKKKERAFHS